MQEDTKMLRKRILSLLGIITAVTVMLAACTESPPPQSDQSPQEQAQTSPDTSGTTPEASESATDAPEPDSASASDVTVSDEPYRIGIFSDVTTINYWSYLGPNSSVWNAYVLQPQRLGLYNTSDITFDVIPQLATVSVERPLTQEGDFYVIEVPMREGVTWSDGTSVTANDFVFTANTVLELQLPGNWSTNFDARFLEKVEAVDDYTVKLYYNTDPGLATHEWGTLQAPFMSEAYWSPIVEEAKVAVGALSAPAADAPQEEQDAYQQQLSEAMNLLYNHAPDGEPLAGAFTMGKWEQGAFIENQAFSDYFQTGAQVEVYVDGAYKETKSGDSGYEILVGDPVSQKLTEYTYGPHTSSVVYTIYGSQDAAILALKNGDIDFILNSLGLQQGLEAQITNQPGIEVVKNPINGYRYLGFNMRREPMNDVAFRQAVAILIDKDFVCGQILQNACVPVDTFVAEANTRWYSGDVPEWGVNTDGTPMTREERIAKAVEILTAAGYSWENGEQPSYDANNDEATSGRLILPNGSPMDEIELLGPVPGYDPLRSNFASWIERWMNDIGIPVRANLKEFNVYRNQVVQEQDFDMYILGWSLDVFPGSLEVFFSSDYSDPGDFNSGGYSNPDFDAKAKEINTCTTVEDCRQVAAELQQILATELPYVILFETGIIEAYRSDVLEYPYTETLSGLQFIQGMPQRVRVAE
jgi:ABC-type transport system substrate-binding protein